MAFLIGPRFPACPSTGARPAPRPARWTRAASWIGPRTAARGCAAALFAAATVLGGCATHPAAAPATHEAAPPVAAAAPAEQAAAPAPLPDVELTPELLFRILYAEIALQRGEPAPAFGELMRLAVQTRDPRLARRATEVALASHARAQALQAAQLWHEIAPGDREAEQTYVSLLVANGRHDEALPLLERDVAAAPNPVEVLDGLQRALSHAPDQDKGYALLERLARPYVQKPDTAFDTHLVLARAARSANLLPDALAQTRAALALRPDSEAAVIGLAQLLVESARAAAPGGSAVAPASTGQAEAAGVLAQFLKEHPDAIDARVVYARVLVGADRLEDAQQQFQEVLQRAPQNPDAHFALGVLALEREDFAQARRFFERYLEILGPNPLQDTDLVYLNMARVAEGERHYEEALDWLHKVHGPEQARAAQEREAFLLVRLNRADDGLQLLRKLPADNDQERLQRTLLQGQLLRDAHRYQESYDLLDQALRADPDDSSLLYETAMSAERLDRIDVMEKRLRRLLELHPDYAHAYNALGYSLADRNIRLQEAYQLIDHALSLSPDDGFIVDSMGWVQYRLGNLEAARAALTRAFRLKADPDVAAHLGEVMWAQGDHAGARNLLLEAQRKDGDSDTLRETLQRLNIRP